MIRIGPCNDKGIRLDVGGDVCLELAAFRCASSRSSRDFSSDIRSEIGRSDMFSWLTRADSPTEDRRIGILVGQMQTCYRVNMLMFLYGRDL